MGVEHAKILLFNRGDHSYLAERFARDAEKVWSFTPILGRQPKNQDDQIDTGLEGVEVVDDFRKYRDKADLIVFPGEYDGEECNQAWIDGLRAFGSGLFAEIENNRFLFLETLDKVGLKAIKTYRAEGFDEAIEYLTGKKDKWIKSSYNRADFDTKHFQTLATFMPWFHYYRNKLGQGVSDTIELLIQNDFPCVCEAGSDRYMVRGKRTPTGTIGYEEKDKSYVYRIAKEIPQCLDEIDAKMESVFKAEHKDGVLVKGAYSGAYSTEVRINEKGEKRFTDLTARIGSPPGEGISESYTSFTQDIFDVADGKMPKMEYKKEYGAMINLISSWNKKDEICVDFPQEVKNNIKLRHSYKHKDNYYCVPNESGGYFGAVVTQGTTLKEAVEKANEIAEQVICLDLEYTPIDLEKCEKLCAEGEKHGILF